MAKKIMFSDKYGLTEAVLTERKTMTRRVAQLPYVAGLDEIVMAEIETDDKSGDSKAVFYAYDMEGKRKICEAWPKYQPGEVVAVAQSYDTLRWPSLPGIDWNAITDEVTHSKGWSNKMFVKAEYMPHRIRITNIRIERMQDITEEDALREGIYYYEQPPLYHEMDRFAPWPPYVKPYKHDLDNLKYRATARYAFAYLIDKVNGTGTWRSNPWTFVYEFKLIR